MAERKPPKKKAARKKAAKPKSKAKPRAPKKQAKPSDETQEYALGDDFLADLNEVEEAKAEDASGGDDTEVFDREELSDEHPVAEEPAGEPPMDTEEAELQEIINAETQEWDGIDPEDEAYEEDEDYDEEADHDDAEQTLVARASSATTSGFRAVGSATTSGFNAVKKHVRFPIWARFLTAAFVIIVSVGTATAANLILFLEDVGDDLTPIPGVEDKLSSVEGGEPQTIMIIGSDKRPELKTGDRGLSDTTMLLRVDPDRNALALFSLPRDLRVDIPGYGTAKLNEAYFAGGPELTLRTIQELTKTPATPNGLEINHVVNIDFEGFARAVNALDCVYVDVDRRYFNTNDDSLSELDDYEEIDIQPGYQALCGFDALDYARYRHTDNDIIRAARQQDFLREARQKVPPEVLFNRRNDLISIFTEHTSSDIRNAGDMLEVLKLFIEARNAPLKQVKFEGTIGPSFVDTTPQEVNRAVTQFLGLEDSPGARASTAAPEDPSRVNDEEEAPDASEVQNEDAAAKKNKKKGGGGSDEPVGVVETSFGKELAKGIRGRKVKLPVYYPSLLEEGSDYDQKPRVYKINGTGDGSPPNSERAAYKWVFSRPALGEYYGFMGTRWQDPPILRNPSEEREIGDRTYKFYYDGDRLRMIAWQDDEGSFWVSNTLAQSLTDREMLEIAKGMTELPPKGR